MRKLRANLVEHYDFEAVFPTVWAHLYSWYSADTQIARYYKVDESMSGEDALLGSMGHNTLQRAMAQGKISFSEGQQQLKNLVLDLYPPQAAVQMSKADPEAFARFSQ